MAMTVFHDVMQSLNQLGFVSSGLILLLVNSFLDRIKRIPWSIWNFLLHRYSYSCEIRDSEAVFFWVCAWLDKQEYLFNGVRGSIARSKGVAADAVITQTPMLGKYYFWFAGRLFSVVRSRRDLTSTHGYSEKTETETIFLRVYLGSRRRIDELLAAARDASAERPAGIAVYQAAYGEWRGPAYLPGRDFSSVFLPRRMESDLREDVGRFLASADWYKSRGVPYRRGYLIYGEPGTGKTSAVRALCSELDLTLGVISARGADVSESALIQRLADIPKPAVVLLEDIDRLFADAPGATVGADAANPTPTIEINMTTAGGRLAGFLNALDGIASAEGYVLIMTANHPDVLDPALCRPGRIDRKFYLSYAEPEQAARLFGHFYGPDHAGLAVEFGCLVGKSAVVMAYLQELLMEHRDDPASAVAQLRRHVAMRGPAPARPERLRLSEVGAVAV